MKANANLEGAAAGVEHRKEREVFPSLIHARPPLPHGGKFSRTDAVRALRRRPSASAHLRMSEQTNKTRPPGGGPGFRPGGACEPTRAVLVFFLQKSATVAHCAVNGTAHAQLFSVMAEREIEWKGRHATDRN